MTDTIIEVFKTDVDNHQLAEAIRAGLKLLFPYSEVNFDLDDCDRILRVEGRDFSVLRIIETVNVLGYKCEILE